MWDRLLFYITFHFHEHLPDLEYCYNIHDKNPWDFIHLCTLGHKILTSFEESQITTLMVSLQSLDATGLLSARLLS